MLSMMPYRRNSALSSMFPFDNLEDWFAAPISNPVDFKMDVEDAGDAYVVSAHVPGVAKDELDVELNEGRLSISVDKRESDEDKQKNYLHKETSEYKATRGVYLKDAASEGLTAKLADGVLTVRVPKQDEKQNITKISID